MQTRTAPVRTTADVAALGTILGVWAHPDDEVYLSAGLMAAAAAAGNRVVVVTVTRGERGTDDPARWPPARLAAERLAESAAALALLDAGHERIGRHLLGADTGRSFLDGHLALGDPAAAVAELTRLVDAFAPDTVLTFGPDGMTGHPDHRAVSAWTAAALEGATWPVPRLLHAAVRPEQAAEFGAFVEPMGERGDGPVCPPSDLAVDLALSGAALDRKVAALELHATQTGPLRAALGGRYRAFVATECFRVAD
ncbi:PIG-L deacetylase family protein [Pseudonocardia sp.]|uniref:PIG-L deacetylase family protein n=1 Tax=Pseudonocardia sp. TaxID=60912 RepID=UPI003D0AF1F4